MWRTSTCKSCSYICSKHLKFWLFQFDFLANGRWSAWTARSAPWPSQAAPKRSCNVSVTDINWFLQSFRNYVSAISCQNIFCPQVGSGDPPRAEGGAVCETAAGRPAEQDVISKICSVCHGILVCLVVVWVPTSSNRNFVGLPGKHKSELQNQIGIVIQSWRLSDVQRSSIELEISGRVISVQQL